MNSEGKVQVGNNSHSHQVEVVPMSKPGTIGENDTLSINLPDGIQSVPFANQDPAPRNTGKGLTK